MPNVRTWERRMVCKDPTCGRTVDVLRAPGPDDGTDLWEGRAERDVRKRERRPFPRPTGIVPRHMIDWSAIPEPVVRQMANEGLVLAYCHREKCCRLILLDPYEIARMCRETEGDRIEV